MSWFSFLLHECARPYQRTVYPKQRIKTVYFTEGRSPYWDHVFGQPSRITATTAMGRAGIIDIDREAEMSGSIHTKGVLILAGFLRSRFAQKKPLALTASLTFEQNYGGIDGDSASSAELYALLSSLADVPIRQGVAVTGSVRGRCRRRSSRSLTVSWRVAVKVSSVQPGVMPSAARGTMSRPSSWSPRRRP